MEKPADATKQMAEFVRWATDVYLDFLDTRASFTQSAAQYGLSKVIDVRKPPTGKHIGSRQVSPAEQLG